MVRFLYILLLFYLRLYLLLLHLFLKEDKIAQNFQLVILIQEESLMFQCNHPSCEYQNHILNYVRGLCKFPQILNL